MKPVLVTGGNGHLGFNLVSLLRERGYAVRATVRGINDTLKMAPLRALGVELVEADLLDPTSLARAMKDIAVVFHTAAPNVVWSKNPEAEIVRPLFEGTRNVVEAAKASLVKRLVMTSSCASIGMDAPEGSPLVEAIWHDTPVMPLIRAKRDAERYARDFCRAHGIAFTAICLPGMIGPGFYRHTPGTKLYAMAREGKLPPLPALGFHLVDARDAALAHVLSIEHAPSADRYIAASTFVTGGELLDLLKVIRPGLKVSSRPVPRWVLGLVCGGDWIRHLLTGRPRELTRSMVREFVGKYQRVSTARIENDLGWKARPIDETLRDTLAWIESNPSLHHPS